MADTSSLLELASLPATSSQITLSSVLYTMRVELMCVFMFVILWATGTFTRQRVTKFTKEKPDGSVPRSKRPLAPVQARRPHAVAREAPSTGHNDHTSSAEACALNARQLAAADATQLCDAAFVVPRIMQLCRSQVQAALGAYKSARQVGLDIKAMPATASDELFMAIITASLRIGQTEDALWLLRDLRQHGRGVDSTLLASTVKLCTSKQLYGECLSIYDFVTSEASFTIDDKAIWSCLLFCSVESKSFRRCEFFFDQLAALDVPSAKDYWNIVRFGAAKSDWQLLLRTIDDMTKKGVDIDSITYNTVLACCVSANQIGTARKLLDDMAAAGTVTDVITYNTLLKGYAKAGAIASCFELFEIMKQRNHSPSQITYGILLDACINEKQVDRAVEVFDTMIKEKCPMNVVLYTTLIKGFSRSGKVDEAMNVYSQMTSERSVAPDLITFSILIKANCDASRLDVALELLAATQSYGLRPDEVVFNNLLSGCASHANAELAKRLYQDMVASGVHPSNATFSILIRLYQQCKMLDEAVEMLRTEPAKHNVDVEPRLYSQLMQCCIRARQGRRGLEVYELMAERSTLCAATNGTLLAMCGKLNMFDTAAEILSMTAEKGGRVDVADARALLDTARRKGKTQCVGQCVAAMQKLGMPVN